MYIINKLSLGELPLNYIRLTDSQVNRSLIKAQVRDLTTDKLSVVDGDMLWDLPIIDVVVVGNMRYFYAWSSLDRKLAEILDFEAVEATKNASKEVLGALDELHFEALHDRFNVYGNVCTMILNSFERYIPEVNLNRQGNHAYVRTRQGIYRYRVLDVDELMTIRAKVVMLRKKL